jgi:hypothetical protein
MDGGGWLMADGWVRLGAAWVDWMGGGWVWMNEDRILFIIIYLLFIYPYCTTSTYPSSSQAGFAPPHSNLEALASLRIGSIATLNHLITD